MTRLWFHFSVRVCWREARLSVHVCWREARLPVRVCWREARLSGLELFLMLVITPQAPPGRRKLDPTFAPAVAPGNTSQRGR